MGSRLDRDDFCLGKSKDTGIDITISSISGRRKSKVAQSNVVLNPENYLSKSRSSLNKRSFL